MKFVRYCTIAATAMAALIAMPSGRAQGLYGDEGKNVTSGELNNQDYWWAKFDAMMLELAIKQHQPEGKISIDLASSIRRLDDLSKQFPKHQEIAKWKARAAEIDAKINPNADRSKSFGPECPWDESNFAQLWVNLHWAKAAFDAKDYSTALSCMQNVMQNFQFMLRPDRMKDYPEELRKYVEDSKPDADNLYKAAKAKTSR
jgi:hypothetical protein